MKSRKLFRESKCHIPSGVNSPVRAFRAVGGTPLFIKKGKGAYLYDVEGRRYLDFCLSWGPLIFGHAPGGLVETLRERAKSGTSFGAPTERETAVAKLIKRAFPSIEKVRLVSSGTEAVMSAIRLARGVTGRKKILKIEGGYHGHVDSLLTGRGIPGEFSRLTVTVPFNDPGALARIFRKEGKNLAAFILEPVPANMGVILPRPGYLERARSLTRKSGTVLIFDEVITGFRLARGGAQERFGIEADLTCLGKVLGGGLPLAAFGGKSRWMNELAPEGGVYQAGTLSGNPLAASAALWTLQKLSSPSFYESLEKKSEEFYEALRGRIQHYRWPLELSALGSIFTLFFNPGPVTDFKTAQQSDTRKFARFFHAVLKEGIYLAPSQFEADFISAAHERASLLRAEKIFERVLRKIF